MKVSKINVKLLLHVSLAIFFVYFAWKYIDVYLLIERDSNVKYDVFGQDKYTYFGDGRFQVMNWPTDMTKFHLVDFKYNTNSGAFLVFDVYKYFLSENMLYIYGNFRTGTATNKEDELSFIGGINPTDGSQFFYNSFEEVPNYLILNIETGEAHYYVLLGEMSDEGRAMFTKDLNKECIKERTCYEASFNRP